MTTLNRAERRARRLTISKHQSGRGYQPGGRIRRYVVPLRTSDLQALIAERWGLKATKEGDQ